MACALDRAVVWALGIVLALALAVSAYALWDAYALANGGDSQARLAALKSGDAVSFSELLALNPDVCAWITIDNTNIDYPVVRGKDDFEYLSKDATGAYSASGSIFSAPCSSRKRMALSVWALARAVLPRFAVSQFVWRLIWLRICLTAF